MEALPRIWVDWNEVSEAHLVSLDSPDTIESFRMQGVPIEEGVRIRIYGEDLEADAVVVKHDSPGLSSLKAGIVEGTLEMIHKPWPPAG